MRNNIPAEMRELSQWVCSDHSKLPLDPRTGCPASVLDPRTWATFDEANRRGSPHIGFVLTEKDPYTIIDLDNKPDHPCTDAQWIVHRKILDAFPSYTEISASGRGYHIVVKGQIPASIKRDNVEVYSSRRYMICTGNVVRNGGIKDCQPLLDQLFGEMKPAAQAPLDDQDGILTDEDVIEMAMHAANAEKFNALCLGDWAALGYPSQSEADFALLSMFTFYSLDNEQCRRLFRMSNLGKRDKAAQDNRYLDRALRKIRAAQPAPLDFTELAKRPVPETSPVSPPIASPPDEIKESVCPSLPPGLIGELATYIYQTSIRPVPEVSLAAAVALVAGIAGRTYNVSGSGLNQYIVLLAKTGSGKDGASAGIDRLLAAVRRTVPMTDQFIGPSMFASGQALIKVLDERPCFVSVLGEFGFTLRQMCDPKANSATVMLKRVLLDLYSKSGWNSILRSSVYSDKDKNTKLVQAPNVTILGESTPEAFFDGLDSSHIAEGLIPRFTILEYTGPRPPRNPQCSGAPSAELVTRLAELSATSLTMAQNNSCCQVQLDPAAKVVMDEFDAKADHYINEAGSDVDMQLWNRAHLKALKLAALVAVGCNPYNPAVDEATARWSVEFVTREVQGIARRYSTGNVGTGDHQCENDIRRAITTYLAMSPAQRAQLKTPKELRDKPVIPYSALRRKCRLLASFRNDRRGSDRALKETFQTLVENDVLVEVTEPNARRWKGVKAKLYIQGESW